MTIFAGKRARLASRVWPTPRGTRRDRETPPMTGNKLRFGINNSASGASIAQNLPEPKVRIRNRRNRGMSWTVSREHSNRPNRPRSAMFLPRTISASRRRTSLASRDPLFALGILVPKKFCADYGIVCLVLRLVLIRPRKRGVDWVQSSCYTRHLIRSTKITAEGMKIVRRGITVYEQSLTSFIE